MAQVLELQRQQGSSPAVDRDAASVQAALDDPEAFAILYRRYATDVYRYCYRRLGDREASEDATSQIFTRAMTGLPKIGNRPFRPWLFTIARNVLIDEWRGHRPVTSLEQIMDREDPSPSPESEAIALESRDAIHLLLLRLPERDRQVMEMRLAGLSGQEIAQAMGCSHVAVRVAHHRALERLREFLAAEEFTRSAKASKDLTNVST